MIEQRIDLLLARVCKKRARALFRVLVKLPRDHSHHFNHAFSNNRSELRLGEVLNAERRLDEVQHALREKRIRRHLWELRF